MCNNGKSTKIILRIAFANHWLLISGLGHLRDHMNIVQILFLMLTCYLFFVLDFNKIRLLTDQTN
jgi:hypothetical protein